MSDHGDESGVLILALAVLGALAGVIVAGAVLFPLVGFFLFQTVTR